MAFQKPSMNSIMQLDRSCKHFKEWIWNNYFKESENCCYYYSMGKVLHISSAKYYISPCNYLNNELLQIRFKIVTYVVWSGWNWFVRKYSIAGNVLIIWWRRFIICIIFTLKHILIVGRFIINTISSLIFIRAFIIITFILSEQMCTFAKTIYHLYLSGYRMNSITSHNQE